MSLHGHLRQRAHLAARAGAAADPAAAQGPAAGAAISTTTAEVPNKATPPANANPDPNPKGKTKSPAGNPSAAQSVSNPPASISNPLPSAQPSVSLPAAISNPPAVPNTPVAYTPTLDNEPTTPVMAPSFVTNHTPSGTSAASSAGVSGTSTTTKTLGIPTIAGMAAGGFVGVVLVIAAVMFFVRRCTKKRKDDMDEDMFNRNSFVRNSVIIPDEAPRMGGRGNPRPPTMIERHFNSPAPSMPPPNHYGNYGQPQQGPAYFGHQYGQQHGAHAPYGYQAAYNPGQGAIGQAYSPLASPIRDAYDDAATAAPYLNNQVTSKPGSPAGGRSLTRSSNGENQSLPMSDLGRGQSVTPYQAAQYAEIGRRLTDSPVGNTNPAQAYARLDRQPHPYQQQQLQPPMAPYSYGEQRESGSGMSMMSAGSLQAPPPSLSSPHPANGAPQGGARPESIYDADDAYDGI